MKVAGIQMDVALGRPAVNRERVAEKIREAASRGAEVVILPEMWNTGYALTRLEEISDVDAEPSSSFLSGLAKELAVNIIAGSISSKRGDNFYNHAFVVNKHGEIIHTYDKIHLFRLMDEEKYLRRGNKAETFALAGVTWGLIICYDLRFPELARKLALEGAAVLVVSAQWPKVRLHHWRSLLVARAIENQQYVVAVNRVGKDDKNVFAGHSLVIDPLGEILYEAGEDEEIFICDLSARKVQEVRHTIPVFQDRIPDCYR